MTVHFEGVCGPKSVISETMQLSLTHLPFMYTSCFVRIKIQAIKVVVLSLSCEVVEKGGFGSPICKLRGYTLDFGHAFPNRTYFRACGQLWLSSVQRALGVAGEKKDRRQKTARIAVKPISGGLTTQTYLLRLIRSFHNETLLPSFHLVESHGHCNALLGHRGYHWNSQHAKMPIFEYASGLTTPA